MILRKLSSALSLLRSEAPAKNLAERMKLNLRATRLAVQPGKALVYRHSNGFPFVVMPDVPETRSLYLAGGSYEKAESAIIESWLTRGDVAIDCGANVGLMSALMASRVGVGGCVVAVEASPDTCRRLEKVMDILGLKQVRILSRCVCDHDGEVIFHQDAVSSEASAIRLDGDQQRVIPVMVRSIRLDSLLESLNGVVPALIKLDIEGAEPKALKGASRLLASANLPLFMIEFYPNGLKRLGFLPADILDQLPLNNYELWHVNFSWPNPAPEFPRGVPFPLSEPYAHRWPLHTNLIAIPRTGVFADRRQRLAGILAS
jgi:FkbM family methyltransferase